MKRHFAIVTLYLWLVPAFLSGCTAQSLQEKIIAVVAGHRASVGVVIENADRSERAAISPYDDFPMQSVYKFPIALAILEKVDEGQLSLKDRIAVSRSELRPLTWSPLREKYHTGKTVFISVFVFKSKEPKAPAEKMIASVARTAWRHFTGHRKPAANRKTRPATERRILPARTDRSFFHGCPVFRVTCRVLNNPPVMPSFTEEGLFHEDITA